MTSASTRPGADDRGLMPTGLLFFVLVLLLGFVMIAMLPLGAAVDQKSRSRTAADAAALAGAEQVRRAWVTVSTAPTVLTFPARPAPPTTVGGGEAATYAAAHQAALTGYDVAVDGLVYARVANTDESYGWDGRAESDARAALPIALDGCAWDNPRPPLVPYEELYPPEPPDPDSPVGEPAPPEPEIPPGPYPEAPGMLPDPRPGTFVRTLVCGEWQVPYVVDNRSGSVASGWRTVAYAVDVTPETLYDALVPRLVQ